MALSLQFLGTGTSVGVPQIGCSCPVCSSTDPRDKRRRSGVCVSSSSATFMVDTPPEFRLACLELGITRADAVVITHAHMDHLAAFDDIRRFNTINGGIPLPCFAAPETIESIHRIFPYITNKPNDLGLYRPMIDFIPVSGEFAIGDVKIVPVPVFHGEGVRTNGYVFEADSRRIAYIPDCHDIPEDSMVHLRNLDLFVIDCLRGDRPHPTHMILPDTLKLIERVAPSRSLLTHVCHSVSHAGFSELLPDGVDLAYDGLKVTL